MERNDDHGVSDQENSQDKALTEPAVKPSRALRLTLFWTNALMLILLIGYTYFSRQALNKLVVNREEDQTLAENVMQQAKKMLNETQALQQAIVRDQAGLKDLKAQLEQTQSRLLGLSGDRHWTLSEVNYLVFMANERLRAAHDLPTALIQLEAADGRLKQLGDPAFLPIQQSLAKDIATLRHTPAVNKQVIWEQLNLLSQDAEKLVFKTVENTSTVVALKESASAALADPAWKKALKNSWQEFKSLIRVSKEVDNPVPPILSSLERGQIVQTLQLLCAQAQWALLQSDKLIYESSLKQLEKMVDQYFNPDVTQQKWVTEIQSLAKQPVAFSVPDLARTLQAISHAFHSTQLGSAQ